MKRKKIEEKEFEKYKRFLNKCKGLMGLSDYRILLESERAKMEEFAEVDSDIHEKIMKISLSDKFYDAGNHQKKNILFHELVHGRVDIFNQKVEKLTSEEEEDLVNDIVRGFEKHKRFEFK